MKKSKLFYLVGVILLSTVMVFSSCKKDEETPTPTPTPTAYTPYFSATAIPYLLNGLEYMQFIFTCTTDDIQVIKVTITAPGGLGTDTFDGGGVYYLQGQPLTVTTDYAKLPGTWVISITGNVTSGAHQGETFVSSATVTTSK